MQISAMPQIVSPQPTPSPQPVFQRAVLDRNMTINTAPIRAALQGLDFSGMAILDFGCGTGNILRLLRETNADVVYAFEVMPEHIDDDIKAWAQDSRAKPRLVINPPAFKIDPDGQDGDLTNYDYFRLLESHAQFGIVSNPPYYLYNRILSLTGVNLDTGDEKFASFQEKFKGALMVTSQGRLWNHPGWDIKATLPPEDFNPPAANDQYLIQTGLTAGFNVAAFAKAHPKPAQKYIGINNRDSIADETDHYPDMWEQLNSLPSSRGPA